MHKFSKRELDTIIPHIKCDALGDRHVYSELEKLGGYGLIQDRHLFTDYLTLSRNVGGLCEARIAVKNLRSVCNGRK